MSGLPKGWVMVPLSKLGVWTGGGTPTTTHQAFWENGTIPWVSPKDMKQRRISTAQDSITEAAIMASTTNLIPANSVMIVTRSGILRHSLPVAINTRPVTMNQDMKALSPWKGLEPNFLYFVFRCYERDILHTCCKGGTTVQSIEAPRLMQFELPIPPANEQRRIVAKVEALFSELEAGVAALKQARAQLAVYRQALLRDAFEGRLTAAWRSKHAPTLETGEQVVAAIRHSADSFTPSREDHLAALPQVPREWGYTYLSNLGELGRGKSKHRPRNDPALFGGPYPFLQTGEIKAANGVIRNYEQTYNEFGLKQSKLWPKGTLCITIAANIAETAFLGFDACFPDSVVGFTPREGAVLNEFVELFIRSAKARIAAYAPATAQKNINLETLENLLVPVTSIKEQQKLVTTLAGLLSVVDSLETDIEVNLAKAEALRQAILKKAFAGELVPQDPADEPAAALLARIQAEREAASSLPRAKSKDGPAKDHGLSGCRPAFPDLTSAHA